MSTRLKKVAWETKAAVTAIYYRLPSEQEAAAAGFSVEDYALEDVALWPENKAAFDLFFSLRNPMAARIQRRNRP